MEGKLEVYTCPLTSEENVALAKFLELLKTKNIVFNTVQFDSGYLVRFLRARKLDLNKTFEMFTAFLKWRKDNNVDESAIFKPLIIKLISIKYKKREKICEFKFAPSVGFAGTPIFTVSTLPLVNIK